MNEKKEFFKFQLFILIIFSLVILLFNYISVYTMPFSNDYNIQNIRAHKEIRSKKYDIANLIVLGDSTALRAYNFTDPNIQFHSLALNGGGLVESYYALHNFLKINPSPKCLVITNSYGAYDYHLINDNLMLLVEADLYSLNEAFDYLRTAFLRVSLLNFFMIANSFVTGQFIRIKEVQNLILENYFQTTSFDNYLIPILNNGAFPTSWNRAKSFPKLFSNKVTDFLNYEFKPNQLNDYYLLRIMKLIGQTKVYVVYPPMAFLARNKSSEDWLLNYDKHIKNLLKEYNSVQIESKSPWLANEYFYDKSHLLNFGTKVNSIKYLEKFKECF